MLAVLDEAAAWLQEIGVTEQWPASFSGNPDALERGRRLLGQGSIFVALLEHQVVSCFALQAERGDAWPPDVEAALYLFSLAVSRRVAGQGVGRRMLDWAWERARAEGKSELRLDCWTGNERLKRYYLEAGFEWRGDIDYESRGDLGLRSLGSRYKVSLFARTAEAQLLKADS